MKNVVKKFNSVAEYEKYLSGGTTQEGFEEASYTATESFTHTKSYDEANERLLKGDKDLAAKINTEGKIEEVRRNLFATARRRQTYSSVVGCAPNVPAFVAGAPNSMIAQRIVKVRQKVVNIVYNQAASYNVYADDLIRVGATLLHAILKIEAGGRRVNLYSGLMSSVKGQAVASIVKIKDSGQPLDVLNAAYPLASPSFLRRHGLRFIEVSKGVSTKFNRSYGSPMYGSECGAIIKECGLPAACVVSFRTLRGKSADDVLQYILDGGDVR